MRVPTLEEAIVRVAAGEDITDVLHEVVAPTDEKALPIGTVRQRAGGAYRKVGPRDWRPVPKGTHLHIHPSASEPAHAPKADQPKSAKQPKASTPAPAAPKAPEAPKVTMPGADAPTTQGLVGQLGFKQITTKKDSVRRKEDPIPPKRDWIPHMEGLPPSTASLAWPNDVAEDDQSIETANPERVKAVWDPVIDKALRDVQPVPPGTQPVAVVMMGAPASGKSSISSGLPRELFVAVDPDECKQGIPEYRQAVGLDAQPISYSPGGGHPHPQSARDAAFMAHLESSAMAKAIQKRAMEQRKNILLDGTGANADSMIAKIKKLQAAGYHVKLMMPDLDAAEGERRSVDRAEKCGRFVPLEDVLRPGYANIPGNFELLARYADDAALFDTRRPGAPCVWSRENGVPTIHDQKFMEEYTRRWPPKPATITPYGEAEPVASDVLHPDDTNAGFKRPTTPKPGQESISYYASRLGKLLEVETLPKVAQQHPSASASSGKPSVNMSDLIKAFQLGHKFDQDELAKMPKAFGKDEGVQDVVDFDDKHIDG